ncbi:MAG: hypothetical protein AB8B74_08530 [Crocinitomicaceae bacterium]
MKLVLIILCFYTSAVYSQNEADLIAAEEELVILLKQVRDSKTDSERELHNIDLYQAVKDLGEINGILEYPFNKITSMSTIKSPDGEFRLFNWNVENNNLEHSHYCILFRKSRGSKKQSIIEFKEDKYSIPPKPTNMLTPNKWYGALYYKIVAVKVGNKTLYTIMGYNGGRKSSNKKLLDVFWFKGSKLRIGYPLFEDEDANRQLQRRVFFEYSEQANVSVKFIPEIGKIVFDHLAPENKGLEGMYEYYIPDLTYDAYYWKDGHWKYQKDIQVGNKSEKTTKVFYTDPKTGETKFKVEKKKWEDPTGEGSAGSGEKHVAVNIENGDKKPDSDKKKKQGRVKKQKKSRTDKKKPQSAVIIK